MGESPTRPLPVSVLVALGVAVLSGCRRTEDGEGADPLTDVSRSLSGGRNPSTATETNRLSAPARGTGTVEGTVRFVGEKIPTSTIVPVGADAQYCGHEHSKEDWVIDAEHRVLRYAIVHLDGDDLDRWEQTKPEYLLLDNKNCRFEPHAAVLTVGSTIELHNSDEILHTAHAYFAATFNVALPQPGASEKRVLSRPGIIQIRCDNHGWMNSFIRVDRHPFHAVTDSEGRFRIVGVPAGTYTLEAWHERSGSQRREVTVRDRQTTKVDLTFAE